MNEPAVAEAEPESVEEPAVAGPGGMSAAASAANPELASKAMAMAETIAALQAKLDERRGWVERAAVEFDSSDAAAQVEATKLCHSGDVQVTKTSADRMWSRLEPWVFSRSSSWAKTCRA